MTTPPPDPVPAHPERAGTGRHRVLITGSRTWTDTHAITTALDHLLAVHGACPRGADRIADT